MIFIIGRENNVFSVSVYSTFMYCINILITQRVMRQSEPTRYFAVSRRVALMRILSHCFSRRANERARESCAVTSNARLFELLNNWRHNKSPGHNRKVINIRTRIRGPARGGSDARTINVVRRARTTLYLIHRVLILILISMHTITGWVSRNLHAITMRRVQRGRAFDGCENNVRLRGRDVEIILSVSRLVPELFARTTKWLLPVTLSILTVNKDIHRTPIILKRKMSHL